MSVLPSPIPHPLDYAPWDVPGWIYDALDWVIGVQWPEGDERAVWDLADRWYAVATVLAGPHADAVAAAAEVRSGYGGVGAVDAAFEGAWRRVAEGDQAPLPVLLAASADLGRLVEECGCDIEGAKLEVWIELGILVVELLSLAVAAVLTAGAASPAAGAAITATRLVVQQIFKRLMGQLARKSLRHGLKEAGERAAKEVAKGGARGLARRAALGGLEEAGEEAGVSLATQAYQNSTGRAHGLDLTDLGASAVGGLAGGAVAPLAGLGRHATGRAARVGEHFGREMTGEMLAENAASLATGQGLSSVEDAARAAASGATGSATGQADHALRARVDGQMSALAGTTYPPPNLGALAPGMPTEAAADPASRPERRVEIPSPSASGEGPVSPTGTVADEPANSVAADPPRTAATVAVDPATSTSPDLITAEGAAGPAQIPAEDAAGPGLTSAGITTPTMAPAHGTVAAVSESVAGPAGVATTAAVPPVVPPATNATTPAASLPTGATGPIGVSGAGALGVPRSDMVTTPSTGLLPGLAPQAVAPAVLTQPATGAVATPLMTVPAALATPASTVVPVPVEHDQTVPGRPPVQGTTAAPVGYPPPEQKVPSRADALQPDPGSAEALRPRTAEWYAARWLAEHEAFERRRYRGHYEHQRRNHEENRRSDRAAELRAVADRGYDETRWLISQARILADSGRHTEAERYFREGRARERWCDQQRDLAEAVLGGTAVPSVVGIDDEAEFLRINDDVGALALGAVETADRSGLNGDDVPPPIDDSRPYGRPGGLRPPLALHQVDVERQMPRQPDGTVVRTADPRRGGWFRLLNDGGPEADATRGINCLDCTLSLFETWLHGRPRVSAPRTFDGYLDGDIRRPIRGEAGGPGRVEDVTGGRFQRLLAPATDQPSHPVEVRRAADRGYANLHDQLLLGGHGSYAFLITEWPHGGSHAWVALNQNGTVLYLDPQTGLARDRPLYPDVVGIDALLLGGDGRPMPLGGLPRGRFSERPDLPDHPPAQDDGGHGDPYINRMYLLLDGPGAAEASLPPHHAEPSEAEASTVPTGPGPERAEGSSGPVPDQRVAGGGSPARSVVLAGSLDEVFAAGVSPGEFAAAVDSPTLRRLVPELDEAAAQDVARLFGDVRVRDMLYSAWREPPQAEPRLAESLVRQLVQQPDLVRMILATPELANSLTARPLTLHHLASHQQAIDVLGEVLAEIAERGADLVAAGGTPTARPTPLTASQARVTSELAARRQADNQLGFDPSRRHDGGYRSHYVRWLYAEAEIAQRELNALVVRLSGDRARPGWRASPKDHQRVLDKLVEYDGDASRLRDLAAAKLEFRRLDDLYMVLRELGQDPEVVVLEIKDRFLRPLSSGYRDILLRLRMSNGHVAELRLHLAVLEEVAEWEHALYEVRRDLDALAEAEDRPLTAVELAAQDGLLKREQAAFWRALGYHGEAWKR